MRLADNHNSSCKHTLWVYFAFLSLTLLSFFILLHNIWLFFPFSGICLLGSSWVNVHVTQGPNPNYLLLKSIWWSLSSCWQHANFHPGSTRTTGFQEESLCWDFQKSAMRWRRILIFNRLLRFGHVWPHTFPPPPEKFLKSTVSQMKKLRLENRNSHQGCTSRQQLRQD